MPLKTHPPPSPRQRSGALASQPPSTQPPSARRSSAAMSPPRPTHPSPCLPGTAASAAASSASSPSPSSSFVRAQISTLDAPQRPPALPPPLAALPPRRAAPPAEDGAGAPEGSLLALADDTLLAILRLLGKEGEDGEDGDGGGGGDGGEYVYEGHGYRARREETVGAGGARGARGLAGSCRRLLGLWRAECVRALSVAREEDWVGSGEVREVLGRYGGVDEVRLRVPSYMWVDVGWVVGGGCVRRVSVHGARLCGGGVAGLMRACGRGLEVLELSCCAPAVGDVEMGEVVEVGGGGLRVLSLHRSGGRVSDVGGGRIAELEGLEVLDLGWCWGLGDGTFGRLGGCGGLRELRLVRTGLSDWAAGESFPRLDGLRFLDISFCKGLSGRVLEVLPPGLEVLRCEGPDVLHDGVGRAWGERLVELRELYCGSATRLSRWEPLGGCVERLHVLDVAWGGMGEEGAGVLDGADLRVLGLGNCWRVGNAVMERVKRLRRLRRLGLAKTGVGIEGVRGLGERLERVDLRGVAGGDEWRGVVQGLRERGVEVLV